MPNEGIALIRVKSPLFIDQVRPLVAVSYVAETAIIPVTCPIEVNTDPSQKQLIKIAGGDTDCGRSSSAAGPRDSGPMTSCSC